MSFLSYSVRIYGPEVCAWNLNWQELEADLIQCWWLEQGSNPGRSVRLRSGSDALTYWAVTVINFILRSRCKKVSSLAHPHIQECLLFTPPEVGCATGSRRAGWRALKSIGVSDPLPVSESESLSTDTTGKINGTFRFALMVASVDVRCTKMANLTR